jgi:pimeloyl-ACP methyl ester carboxylesterase
VILEKLLQINNQKLGVYEYGQEDGQVVFYFHGFPGSRLDGVLFDFEPLARDLGLRIIAIDRPGIGNSDFQPNRKLQNWISTVSSIADLIKVDKFSVLAISGGAPYGFAVAYGLPDRLYSLTIVSGMGPFDYRESLNGTAMLIPKLNSIIRKIIVWLMNIGIKKNPEKFKRNIINTLPECDNKYLVQSGKINDVVFAFQEALKQGLNGYLQEAKIYKNKWQFNLSEIRAKVILWHGTADNNVKIELAQRIESEIPDCKANYIENEGHFSLTGKYLKNILTEIKQNINGKHNGNMQ